MVRHRTKQTREFLCQILLRRANARTGGHMHAGIERRESYRSLQYRQPARRAQMTVAMSAESRLREIRGSQSQRVADH